MMTNRQTWTLPDFNFRFTINQRAGELRLSPLLKTTKMANQNDKYHHCTDQELRSLEWQIARIMGANTEYKKDYLSDEIEALKSARKISPQQRQKIREAMGEK